MDVGHGQRRQLVRAEHAVDQVTQAVGFLDDHVGIVAQAFFRQLAGQQLGCAADAAKGVLDFVGQATHQHLGGFLLAQLGLFLGNAQQSVARVHLQQQQGLALVQDRRYRVVDGDGLPGQRGELRFALGERVRLLDRLAQRAEGLGRLGEQFADELPMAALATDRQEHFRSRVHVLKAQLGVEQQRGGGQVVQKQTVLGIADGHRASSTSFGACRAWARPWSGARWIR
ncbi:hypothetical protein D3C72_991350 [compost metagenome]